MANERDYLVEPIPSAPFSREALGIHQSDVVIRTAIQAGLADLRANPNLLKYVFSSLPTDGLTYAEYGEQQVDAAAKWFLSQDIPVFMNTRVDESKIPCITIGVQGSTEAQATLGDVHYETSEEEIDAPSIRYYGPLSPTSYNPDTGVLVLPTDFEGDVSTSMLIEARGGSKHTIYEVLDPWTIIVDEGINTDLTGFHIVSAGKAKVSLESLDFKENFEIGCHVLSEPIYLTYLHSILTFILLRYKEALLEGRGLERTTISSGPVVLNTSFPASQLVFSRIVQVQGFVRQYWPKLRGNPIEALQLAVQARKANATVDDIAVTIVDIDTGNAL